MAEHEDGVGTRISRRKAIKLGALGAAGGAAAWLLPGTAGAGTSLAPPGICPRGSGDVCGRQIRQCGVSKPPAPSAGALCVCASDSRTVATHCVEDRPDLGTPVKCQTKLDCAPGQLCVKRCIDLGIIDGQGGASAKRAQQFEVVTSICAWPCGQGPGFGED